MRVAESAYAVVKRIYLNLEYFRSSDTFFTCKFMLRGELIFFKFVFINNFSTSPTASVAVQPALAVSKRNFLYLYGEIHFKSAKEL